MILKISKTLIRKCSMARWNFKCWYVMLPTFCTFSSTSKAYHSGEVCSRQRRLFWLYSIDHWYSDCILYWAETVLRPNNGVLMINNGWTRYRFQLWNKRYKKGKRKAVERVQYYAFVSKWNNCEQIEPYWVQLKAKLSLH